jgi:membrane fusion protein, multidrug efflux system
MKYYSIPVSALLILTAVACNNPRKANKRAPVQIPTVKVKRQDLQLQHLYVTDIQAIRNVEIRSKVSGYLEAIFVDEGKPVKKGQVLFRISDNEYKSEVVRCKAQMSMASADKKAASVEYERVKVLADKNIVSVTEQDLARARLNAAISRVEEAASNLENAQYKLSYTVVRAPFDGVIDRIPLKAGSLLNEGTLISSLSDISSVYAYFNISENEYLKYMRNLGTESGNHDQSVSLVLSDGKEYESKGVVETIVSEFQPSTGSIAFRARFPNPHKLLKHNATGKVKLYTKVDGALLIPQKSAFEIQDKNYVFVIDSGNVAHMKHFMPGGRSDEYYIIRSGLHEGDVVAYEGIQNLKDGMQVVPKSATPVKHTVITSL